MFAPRVARRALSPGYEVSVTAGAASETLIFRYYSVSNAAETTPFSFRSDQFGFDLRRRNRGCGASLVYVNRRHSSGKALIASSCWCAITIWAPHLVTISPPPPPPVCCRFCGCIRGGVGHRRERRRKALRTAGAGTRWRCLSLLDAVRRVTTLHFEAGRRLSGIENQRPGVPCLP